MDDGGTAAGTGRGRSAGNATVSGKRGIPAGTETRMGFAGGEQAGRFVERTRARVGTPGEAGESGWGGGRFWR